MSAIRNTGFGPRARKRAWAALQSVLPKLAGRQVRILWVRGRPVRSLAAGGAGLSWVWPRCCAPLLTDSGVTGFGTQLSGGEDRVYSLWRPGIQKSTWIWTARLLDVPAMEQNTQHIIPKQRSTHQRFDSASALPSPGCAPAPAERSGGQSGGQLSIPRWACGVR